MRYYCKMHKIIITFKKDRYFSINLMESIKIQAVGDVGDISSLELTGSSLSPARARFLLLRELLMGAGGR